MNLREEMPETYAFIEACREAFGKESVNPQIKLGMEGAQTFHATENGIEVGTKFSDPVKYITADKMVIREKTEAAQRLARFTAGRHDLPVAAPFKKQSHPSL